MRSFAAIGALLLLFATSVASTDPPRARSEVAMPVVFNDVLHEADQFNALRASLPADLHFAIVKGEEDRLYAFTTAASAKKFVEERSKRSSGRAVPGMAAPVAKPSFNHNCSDTIDPYWSEFFQHIDCGGFVFSIAPSVQVPTMPSGWNDVVSSVACSYGYPTNYCVLYEHSNYGGSSLWISWGVVVGDLRGAGWNDRTSSIIVYTV